MVETVAKSQTAEVYARSLASLRGLGRVAVLGYELDYRDGHVQEAWQDFKTAVGENLATDPEFGEQLMFSPMRSYVYRDGHVLAANGQPIIELVRNGLKASEQAAQTDPEMHIQVIRDLGDVEVARIVDSLQPGELYAAVSLDPKEALDRNPTYWQGKGYRKGMAVLQVYYRAAHDEVLAGAYSIKQSNRAALARIFARYGTHIPLGTDDNLWIRYGVRLATDREQAEEFGKAVVRAHRDEIGLQGKSLSVTELIEDNEQLVQACFERYMQPLARSLVSGRVEPAVRDLAQQLLCNGAQYSSADYRSLMRLCNGRLMHEDDARFMEEKIRYALVEELRKLVPKHLKNHVGVGIGDAQNGVSMRSVERAVFLNNMGHVMAGNIAAGFAANRSYGGCASAGANQERQGGVLFGAEQQNVFGGNAEEEEVSGPRDKFGPLKFKCPKGHWNKRPPARSPKDFLTHCKTCNASLKC